jgi:hypothetical protein
MKHILPILTIMLLGMAVTASASNFYYDYYLSYSNTDPVDNDFTYADKTYHNQHDTFTYGAITSFGTEADPHVSVSEDNTFTAYRESNWGNDIAGANPNNFFRIEIGKKNTERIQLYLTDFVSSIYGSDPVYNSDSNALFNDTYDEDGNLTKRAIVEYGYRTLTLKDGKYVAGETQSFSTVIEDPDGTIKIDAGENGVKTYRLNEKNVTEIDKIGKIGYGEETQPVARYQYNLGSFDPKTIIEVYMKDNVGGEVYSFSSYVNEEFQPFNNKVPTLGEGDEILDANQGGFSDGGYVVGSTETDKMLFSYYFNKPISEPKGDYHDYTEFDSDSIKEAAQKAMPLSQLIPTNGYAVAFGMYAWATGEAVQGGPLPGGLSIALIAGLFGFGFCYVRRRKAIAG